MGRSKTATALVVGEATIDLERPTIKQALNNTSLDPVAAQFALTALIPPEGLFPTDLLSVTWTGEPGTPTEGSHTTEPRPISEIGFSIALPVTVIPFSLGKPVTVTFAITRGNAPPQTSKPLRLNVLPLVLGSAYQPKLKQATNNGDGPELHLKDLTAEGLMWFKDWPFIALGQYVWLTLTGTKTNGDPYHRVFWAAPFAHTNQDWIDNGFFEYLAPYDDLMELKDGSTLTMAFKAALGGSQIEDEAVSFQVRTYTVKATLKLDLKAPTIKEGPNETLKPIDAKDTLTVVVEQYAGMDAAHEIVVEWKGTLGDGSLVTAPVAVGLVGELKILIANWVVAFNLGKQVTVRYGIIANNGLIQWSEPLSLNVLAIPDESPDWPTPTVPQSPDQKVLDLSKFEGDAAAKCIAWPLIRAKQRIWLRCYGTKADNSPYTIELAKGIEVSEDEANGGLNKVLLRSELALLKDNSELRIELKVSFDGSSNEVEAVTFWKLRLTVKTLKVVQGGENWELENLRPIPVSTQINFNSGLTLVCTPLAVSFRQPVIVNSSISSFGTRSLTSGTQVSLRLYFNGLSNKVNFDYASSHSNENIVRFVDGGGDVIRSIPLVMGSYIQKVAFSSARYAVYLEVLSYGDLINDGGIFLDNITWGVLDT